MVVVERADVDVVFPEHLLGGSDGTTIHEHDTRDSETTMDARSQCSSDRVGDQFEHGCGLGDGEARQGRETRLADR